MTLVEYVEMFSGYVDPSSQSIGIGKTALQSQNNMLWTAEFIHGALIRFPHLTKNYEFMESCLEVLNGFEHSSGILKRHPTRHLDNQDSIDNYVARLGVARYLSIAGDTFPEEFLKHGKLRSRGYLLLKDKKTYYMLHVIYFGKPKGVYNNLIPGIFSRSAWLGRFLQLNQLAKYAQNKSSYLAELGIVSALVYSFVKLIEGQYLLAASIVFLTLLVNRSYFAFALSLVFPFLKDEDNSWALSWHLARAAEGQTLLLLPLIALNKAGRFKRFLEGMGGLRRAYYKRYHPINRALRNV